jgi:DNA-binding transcriptional MerR regulator
MTTGAPLRIGELARRSGRSAHSIRWYDAQGLIPGVRRDAGGRRVFDPRHVEWLALLDRLRATGMSIAQMRSYTALVRQGTSSLARQRDLLAAHRQRVVDTLASWHASLALIDAKLHFYDEWLATGVRPPKEARPRTSP